MLLVAIGALFFILPHSASAVITASSTTYSTAGTFTYKVSTNACTQVIDTWGGGGAGFDGNNSGGGAGGGGGAFASSTLTFTTGTTHTLVVGAGGQTTGANGGDSTVDSTVVDAAGGGGGIDVTTGVGAGGLASASTGTTKNNGGNGGAGRNGSGGGATDEGGGGGGAGGKDGAGGTGTDGASNAGGDGGAGDAGSGGAGATANGGTGTSNAKGGGGGGGGLDSAVGGPGGAPGAGGGGGEAGPGTGAAGQIIVTEYVDSGGCGRAPTVTTTNPATSITVSSATIEGNITDEGLNAATARGFATSTVSSLASSVSTSTETSAGFSTGVWTASFSNTALVGNTSYYFRAYATNNVGTAFGSIVSLLTLPDLPGTPSLSLVAATSTTVTWTAPTGGASTYKLQYCINDTTTCTLSTALAVVSTTTNPSLTGNTTYSFAVRGTNTTGDGAFSASSTQLTLPNIPGTPTFSSITATTMRVSYAAPTGGAATYKVDRCAGSGCTNFVEVASGVATAFYDDSSLTPGATYRYRVRGTNLTGDGLYSTPAEQATLAVGPTVTTDAASLIAATSSTIGGNITATGGSNATARGFATSSDSSLATSVSTSTESGSFSTGSWTAAFSNADVVGNTTYYYRAYATNSGGTGYGSITSVLTLPNIPGTPTFASITATTMTVNWTAPTGGATTYKLERCTGSGCSNFVEIQSGLASPTYGDSGLSASTVYRYRVRGTNATGDGLYSTAAEQVTSDQSAVPDSARVIRLKNGTRLLNGVRLR